MRDIRSCILSQPLFFWSFRTPAIKKSILESSPRTPTPFKHALAAQEMKYGPLKMLVSVCKIIGLVGLLVQTEISLWCKRAPSSLQPQTPSHLVEDLQAVIKQESDESGIVTEFQGNGPLLKKIKQEVSSQSFERNRLRMLFPLFLIDESSSSRGTRPLFLQDFHAEVVQSCVRPQACGLSLGKPSHFHGLHVWTENTLERIKEWEGRSFLLTFVPGYIDGKIIDTYIFSFQMSWRV